MVSDPLIPAAYIHLTVSARWRQYARPPNTQFLGIIPLIVQFELQLGRLSRFCTADAAYSLCIILPRPIFLKICPFRGVSGPSSNTSFLWPTRATTPNGISIQSAVFPQYTLVTNRQIDWQTDRQNDELNRPIRIGRSC